MTFLSNIVNVHFVRLRRAIQSNGIIILLLQRLSQFTLIPISNMCKIMIFPDNHNTLLNVFYQDQFTACTTTKMTHT